MTLGVLAVFTVFAFSGVKHASAATCTFTGSLTIGSTGAEVTCLQTALIAGGYSIPAGATGYFGTQTQAAVSAWQAANMVSPTAGYFGPISQAKWALVMTGGVVYPAGCTSYSGYSTTTGLSCAATVGTWPAGCTSNIGYSPTTGAKCDGSTTGGTTGLAGSDGTISDINTLSQYSNEEVGEGESDVKVLGFEVEASNDGDIALKSINLTFDSTGSTGSDHFDDYVDSVSVWMGSTKIGSADAADFNEDSSGIYSKTITLSSGTIRADDTESFYVSVDAVSNLDSGDITGDSWTVAVNSIRYIDGSGVTTTEESAIPTDIDWATAGDGMAMSFVTFSASADTELKISTDSDSPEAGIVMVDDSDNTDGVSLLKGKLELEGTSDANIDAFPVTLTTSGATDLDEITGSLTLIIDGEEYTESVSTSAATAATITFDNMNFDLSAGDTVDFEIKADINDIETGYFEAGDMLKADVSSTNRSAMDVENEEGDQLSDSTEKSGTATGEYQEFRTSGISVELVDAKATATDSTTAGADVGTFEITFNVTAVGDNVYLATIVSNGYTYVVDDSGVATTGGLSAVVVNNDDTDLSTSYNWFIEEGQTEEITLTVVRQAPPTDTGLYRAVLSGIKWDTDDDQTPDNTYSSNLDAFATDYITLN